MLGVYNRLVNKPLSMHVRMFPERLHRGQKAHPEHWQEHPRGWGPGLGTSEAAKPQHPPGLPDWDATWAAAASSMDALPTVTDYQNL